MDINLNEIIKVPTDISESIVIFLDIDGVLNCYPNEYLSNNYTKNRWKGLIGLDEDKVARLNYICAVCGNAKIVISSSWGLNQNTLDALAFYGFDYNHQIIGEIPRGHISRGQQIREFCNVYSITDFIVLEDESLGLKHIDDVAFFAEKVYKLDMYKGITKLDVRNIIAQIKEIWSELFEEE